MESELENAFLPVHDATSNKVFYCSTCWEKYSILQGESYLIACLTLLIGGFVWVMVSPQHELARLVFHVGLFMCFLVLSTVIHEFGHVLAAFAARIKVLQVNVGLGKLLYKCHFLGIEWCFHRAPVSGFVIPGIRSTRFYRTRYFIFTAGGSLFNFLMCIVGAILFFHISLEWFTILLRSFILANLFEVVWCLIPRKVNIAGTNTPSDGLILLKLPFMSQSEIEHYIDYSN